MFQSKLKPNNHKNYNGPSQCSDTTVPLISEKRFNFIYFGLLNCSRISLLDFVFLPLPAFINTTAASSLDGSLKEYGRWWEDDDHQEVIDGYDSACEHTKCLNWHQRTEVIGHKGN